MNACHRSLSPWFALCLFCALGQRSSYPWGRLRESPGPRFNYRNQLRTFLHLGGELVRLQWAIPVMIGLCCGAASAWVDSRWEQQEDAYITYAYAAHLAAGDGWIFSPGQAPSLGSSTPLWAIILAIAARFGIAPHIAAPWLTSLLWAISAALLYLLLAPLAGRATVAVGATAWGLALSVFFRSGGMETALVVALTAALALCLVNPRPRAWPGAILGALLLARPDSGILAVVVIVWWALRRRFAHAARNVGAMAAVCAPWVIYAWHTFGDIVPSSLRAKLAYSKYAGHFSTSQFVAQFLGGYWMLFVAMVACSVVGAILVARRKPELIPLLLWVPAYWAAMAWKAPGFSWYYVPPLWLAYGLAFLGLYVMARCFRIPGWLPAAGLAAALVGANWLGVGELVDRPRHASIHHQLGEYVAAHTPPGALIAAFEVGNLSYWGNRPTLDLLGLTSPEVIPILAVARKDAWRIAVVVRATRPQYVAAPVEHGVFKRLGYREVYAIPDPRGVSYRIYRATRPAGSPR